MSEKVCLEYKSNYPTLICLPIFVIFKKLENVSSIFSARKLRIMNLIIAQEYTVRDFIHSHMHKNQYISLDWNEMKCKYVYLCNEINLGSLYI